MIALSWNCRGMGNPRTVLSINDLVHRFLPKLVLLMEVKVGRESVEKVHRRIKFEGSFFVEGIVILQRIQDI